MLIVKVKICGITNYHDAKLAMDLGADILGFNFYPESPRYIKPEKAGEIIDMLPAYVDIAGLFVNDSFDHITEVINLCHLDWVQLHGDEDPEFCRMFLTINVKTMKGIRVKDKADVEKANDFFTDAILIDAYHPEKYGGTGITFDWNILGNIEKRVFLAGGINSENVAKAIELGVYGIDICSGVESEPGKKDHDKMKKLFENINRFRG